MQGVISAYRLNGSIGRRIAAVKGMSTAWSIPFFMEDMVRNPGPLLVYDKLYLDEPAYGELQHFLDPPSAQFVRDCVESDRLDLFQLFNADYELLQGDEFCVQMGSSELLSDSFFTHTVGYLVDAWGEYAAPTAFRFEAMNIPTMEVIADRLSDRFGDMSIVDHVERTLLYQINLQKKLNKGMVLPHVSRLAIELAPKFFHAGPYRETWTVDDVARFRENRHWCAYRRQMEEIAGRFAERIEGIYRDTPVDEGSSLDVLRELKNQMISLQQDLYKSLEESFDELSGRLAVNKFSVLGGVLSIATSLAGVVNPTFGISLGVTGGAIILADQMRTFLRRRRCEWADFMSFVAREDKRSVIGISMGHEFTHLLVGFGSQLKDIRTRLQTLTQEPYVDRQEQAVKHELDSLQDLVDRSFIRTKSLLLAHRRPIIEFRPHRRLLVELVLQGTRRFSDEARNREITILADRESISNLPPVSVDDETFPIVIDALLDNAIKYSTPGTRIRINGRMIEQFVVLDFENVGFCLRPEDLETIFEECARTDEAKKREPAGLGLGLFIARLIVEMHGGNLTASPSVQSQDGYRTVFSLQLPR